MPSTKQSKIRKSRDRKQRNQGGAREFEKQKYEKNIFRNIQQDQRRESWDQTKLILANEVKKKQ